ncbi:MAG TPA: YggT family protein [Steroidobacteraceae bacterium]|nr:YggT family protein [Steroidobacteraceae bacterium]
MQAIYFIVDTLIGLYQVLLLLRLLMQLTRADFRNPIGRGIVQLTDPLILPLRKIFPPVGKIDSASVLAIIVVSALKALLLRLLMGFGLPGPLVMVNAVAIDLLRLVLRTYLISIILNAILSFVAPGNYSPAQSVLASICNPVLNPIRRMIPPIAGLDLSPLWACIAIQALLIIVR